MSQKQAGGPENAERITVRDLTRASRGGFALAGLSGLVAGGFAVFETTNQAGSVALLAVGSVASILAVVGKVPLKWVISGHEFDMSETAAREAADAVASRLTPSETAELAARLAGIESRNASPMTVAMLDYVAFEQTALARVMNAVVNAGWSYHAATNDRPYDLMVRGPGGARVPVEIRLLRNGTALGRRLRELRDKVRGWGFTDVVVVLSGVTVDRATIIDCLNASDPARPDVRPPLIHVVFYDDQNFDGALVSTLKRAFARTSSD